MSANPLRCLTIGGSDSGGAAGIQADLKTWTALGVYGMSALTAVTAQNSVEVAAVSFISPDLVTRQIGSVLGDYGADGVKTGLIGRVALVEAVAAALALHRPPVCVIDPVLVNQHGVAMFDAAVTDAYRQTLFALADLVTPNRREAELLVGRPLADLDAVDDAAHQIRQTTGCAAVLIKGWRLGDVLIDTLCDGDAVWHLPTPYLATDNVHGSGDTLSAALTALLAQGLDRLTAVRRAQAFTHGALARAVGWRLGRGHGPLAHFADRPGDIAAGPPLA